MRALFLSIFKNRLGRDRLANLFKIVTVSLIIAGFHCVAYGATADQIDLTDLTLSKGALTSLLNVGLKTTQDLQRCIISGEIFTHFKKRTRISQNNLNEIINIANDLGLLSGPVPSRLSAFALRFDIVLKQKVSKKDWYYKTCFISKQKELAAKATNDLGLAGATMDKLRISYISSFFIRLIQLERAIQQGRPIHAKAYIKMLRLKMSKIAYWVIETGSSNIIFNSNDFMNTLFLAYKGIHPKFNPQKAPWDYFLARLGFSSDCPLVLIKEKTSELFQD